MDTLKKIGKYKYGQRHCLGQGSFGKVYQGQDQNGRKVAIKKIQQRMIASDPYLKESLSTQIAIMKKLKHRNIVQLIDTVTTANSIYLILQFCSGGDLKRYSQNKRFTQQQALKILKQILQGFYVIVSQGIIHRDLKPANILVHQGTFKICDFGFAKYFGQMNRMAKTCVGTPIYMSPQVLKQKPYTSKTDVWSLGVVYYQILFGKLPYIGKSQNEIFNVITRGKLTISSCSEDSYLFIRNTLVLDEQQRWDWKKIFDHFDIKATNQKPGFYQNIINNFFGNSKQQHPQQKMIKQQNISNQNRQNRNNSFKEKYNFKNNSKDSPDKQEDTTPKAKHNRMAKNIFAQKQDFVSIPIQQKPKVVVQQQFQVNEQKPQVQIVQQRQYNDRVYSQKELQKLRWLYSVATNFILKQDSNRYTKKIPSYELFLYSLVNYSIGQYNKQLTQINVRQYTKVRRVTLQQQKNTLQMIFQQIKRYQIPSNQIRGIATIVQLEGKNILTAQQMRIISDLIKFTI